MANDTGSSRVDWMKLGSTILDATSRYSTGTSLRGASRFAGVQHRENARRSLDVGKREASNIRREGRELESQALVAMIGQGGTVDSEMLQRIKTESEINAIEAMFDAKADALTHQTAARIAEKQGNREYRAQMLGVGSTILRGVSSFNWDGIKADWTARRNARAQRLSGPN